MGRFIYSNQEELNIAESGVKHNKSNEIKS
jgi:hypothetical protein